MRAARGGQRFARTDSMAAALVVFGAGMFVQALSRYDEIHALPASLVVVILITWLAAPDPSRTLVAAMGGGAGRRRVAGAGVLYFVSPYIDLSTMCVISRRKAVIRQRRVPVACRPCRDRTMSCRFSTSSLPSVAPLYAGLPRHDNVFANDVSIYFLAGRPIATRYHELHPGVTTTQAVQEEMVAELDRAGARMACLHHVGQSQRTKCQPIQQRRHAAWMSTSTTTTRASTRSACTSCGAEQP